MKNGESFFDRLERLRGKRTKAGFSREIGVSPPLYQKWASGSIPGGDKLNSISKATGKSVEWLLTGKESLESDPFYGKENVSKNFSDAYDEMLSHPEGRRMIGWFASAMSEASAALRIHAEGDSREAKAHAYEAQRIFSRIFSLAFEQPK
ncbi:MAG: helix-turn-helix domain-containing protein [Kiritimatiellia bacterium]|jgi:transcriptional regulator with XRE-family HTH domain